MTAKLTAAADGLSGSLAVGANEAFQFKPVAGGLELSQDGITFQTVDTDGKVAFPAMGVSFVSNGYITLPGGFLIQWGAAGPTGANGGVGVNFPVPFPNACLSVTASALASGSDSPSANIGNDLYAGGVTLWMSQPGAGYTIRWIAIGY